MVDLPRPPISAKVDLRDFHFMPLDVVKLQNSETWAMADAWAAKACVNLWCRAWHQVPAGSLPDNDDVLRGWSGVPNWDEVREIALRGFKRYRDGRLYHGVIVVEVRKAWTRKQEGAADREADRQRKNEWRRRKAQRNQQTCPAGQDGDETRTETRTPPGQDAEIHSMTGTGTGTVKKEPPGPKRDRPPHDADPEFDLVEDRPASLDRSEVGKMVQLWNIMAADSGCFPQVQKITAARRSKAKARLVDCGGLEGWGAALTKVRNSPFLTGKNDRGWRADFDFMLQEKSFTKLMEGGYDDHEPAGGGAGPGGLSPSQAAVAGILGEPAGPR